MRLGGSVGPGARPSLRAGPSKASAREDAERDAEARDRPITEAEIPAGHLDLFVQSNPEPEGGGSRQHPPAPEDRAESEAGSDEDSNEDAAVIGSPAPLLKLRPVRDSLLVVLSLALLVVGICRTPPAVVLAHL